MNEVDNFEVILLLTILRDEMKHQEDSKTIQGTIADLIEHNIPEIKKQYNLFL